MYIRNAILLLFFFCLNVSQDLFAKRDFYPYQDPHRFSNKNYVSGGYYLMGDIKIESENQDLYYEVTSDLMSKDKTTIIHSNNNFNIFNEYKMTLDKPGEFVNGEKLIFRPNSNQYPTIIVYRQDDIITIFVKRELSKENGYKLMFNIDEFEKYMTQTWWFDNLRGLDKPVVGVAEERFFSFGFTINADKVNFFDESTAFNISYIYKYQSPLTFGTKISIFEVTDLIKSYDKNRRKKELISYGDFFKGKNQILSIQPMSEENDKFFRALMQ